MVLQIVCRREEIFLPCQVKPGGAYFLEKTAPYTRGATEEDPLRCFGFQRCLSREKPKNK